MKFPVIKAFILLVVALCFVPVSVSAEELSKNQLDPWRFELKPLYLWFLSLEGDTTMPASGGSSDATSSTNEGVLTSAFSIHFEAGKGDWTVFTDYLYAQYTADNISISSSPVQGKNELTVHLSELGVTYRLLADYWYKVELLGGVRYLYVANKFDFYLLGGVRYLYVANKFDFYSDNLDTLSAKDNLWDGFGGGHTFDRVFK